MKKFIEPKLTIFYFKQDSVFMSGGQGNGNLEQGNEGDTDYDIIW